MWLFDNLFLDANTPITINDGIDHSKDVVQAIVDPTFEEEKHGDMWAGGTDDDGSTGDKKDDSKKDDSLVNLFESNKQEELDAASILHPEPPKDIALEIGHTRDIPEIQNSDPVVMFDIGGDMNFDIGGDIASSADVTMDSWGSSIGPSALWNISISSSENILPIISNWTSSLPVELTEVLNPWINPLKNAEDTSSNNTIFSLLNTPSPTSEVQDGSIVVLADSPGSSSLPIWSISSVFPSLFEAEKTTTSVGVASEAVTLDTPKEGISSLWETHSLWIEAQTVSPRSILESPSFTNVESGKIHLSSSSKLKLKLSQFLGELESMEVGDEGQRAHKMQQIDMCRMRISEIRIEYDNRIHALQWEMQALEQEVRDMEGEKTHIKTVIETFQKELDMA